jgi:hypothetical protein
MQGENLRHIRALPRLLRSQRDLLTTDSPLIQSQNCRPSAKRTSRIGKRANLTSGRLNTAPKIRAVSRKPRVTPEEYTAGETVTEINWFVSARINIVLRAVEHVGIAIQILRVVGVLHERIGTNESCNILIVVPAAVVVDAALAVELLAGEAVRRFGIAHGLRSRHLAPGIVLVELDLAGIDIRDDVNSAEMIVVVEEAAAAFLRRDNLIAHLDVLGDLAALDLIAAERKVGGAGGTALLHPNAGVVVGHHRATRTGVDGVQAVVLIPGNRPARAGQTLPLKS